MAGKRSETKARTDAAASSPRHKHTDRNDNDDEMSSSLEHSVDDEEPPKPVSSSSDDDDDDSSSAAPTTTAPQKDSAADKNKSNTPSSSKPPPQHQLQQTQTKGMSRLFAPYRTLGLISSGAPYSLQSHSNNTTTTTGTTLVTLPMEDRFHIYNTDKLQPVLVSQAVPNSSSSGGGSITHLVADASLGITVVAGHNNGRSSSSSRHPNITLFGRTRPLQTIALQAKTNKQQQESRGYHYYRTVDMMNLGNTKMKMTGEKEGTLENALIVAVILAKDDANEKDDEHDDDGIPTVGEDDDDEEEEDHSDDDKKDDDEEEDLDDDVQEGSSLGQVVLLLATRTDVRIQKRIFLSIHPTVAMHPSTYINKIVVGGSDSSLILLNVRSGKVIHTFRCLPPETESTRVTALEQSPAVDTIAVGMSNGMVHLINLRHDKKLFSLRHAATHANSSRAIQITSLSFRTDGSAMRYGIAPLAVGRDDGTISIWDLSPPENPELGRTLLCEMDKVHPGGVCKLTYLPHEPLLLSTGRTSNSVLLHIFDNPDHSGRLLRQRKGHTAPPKHIRYLHPASGGVLANMADGTDASSCQILSSGGLDRTLRVFSSARSVLDKEYSQGRGLEKRARSLGLSSTSELLLPPVTAMTTSQSRSRDWGDLVSIHRHHPFAYVWSTKRGAQSGPILRQTDWNVSAMQKQPPRSVHATAVTMSACGNFCLVGTAGGTIYKYNVQSGIPRGSYPKSATAGAEEQRTGRQRMAGDVNRTLKELEKKLKVKTRKSDKDKEERDAVQQAALERRRQAKLSLASHTGASVTGLAVDSINKTVVSVGADAKLILWNFASHAPHKKSPYKLPSPATKMFHVRDSDLAAIAMEDYTVVLFDCAALSIVRRFGTGGEDNTATSGHTGPVTDLCFSPDGRHLFTSSTDGTIRVWDVPTNTCVDWMSFASPPTSMTVSPTGEFLATTHVGKLGISLWSDRSFYQTVHLDGAHPPSEPARMDEPAPVAEGSDFDEVGGAVERPVLPEPADADDRQSKEDTTSEETPKAKEKGLITLSGLPPAHWKNLFHLELVKERNKPKEPPKKPPSAPFFLQWRGEAGEPVRSLEAGATTSNKAGDDEEWDAAWSDDDDDDDNKLPENAIDGIPKTKRGLEEGTSALSRTGGAIVESKSKKRKVTHYRSHMAALLEECFEQSDNDEEERFQAVTDYMATLGPSAIDVSLSTLCSGMHDLEEGLPLLKMTSLWLLEACRSRQRYEAVNAYLHRFLHLHANVLAGIDEFIQTDDKDQEATEEEEEEDTDETRSQLQQRMELLNTISELKRAQQAATDELRGKMQHTLCMLRHFSRMV